MDLSIPVAVWHAPPSHTASLLAVSKYGKYIVTADAASHQCVLWHVKPPVVDGAVSTGAPLFG